VKPCTNCSIDISDDAVFCLECGSKQQPTDSSTATETYCAKCGAAMGPNSGFCPECGARQEIVQSSPIDVATRPTEPEQTGIVHDSPAAIKLEINANKKLYTNKLGNIEFRITNEGAEPLTDASVAITSRSAGRQETKRVPGLPLGPAQSRAIRLNVEPSKDGEDLLSIRVMYSTGGGARLCMAGESELLIFDPNALRSDSSAQNVSIVVRDATAIDMSNMIKSDSVGGVDAAEEALKSMWKRGEAVWVRVELYPDEVTFDERPRISLTGPVADVSPQTSVKLSSSSDLAGDLLMLSKPVVTMGVHSENDARLLVEPIGDPANLEKTRRMSRRHLEFRYDGRDLSVVDLGSSNGTLVVGSSGRLRPNEAVRIDDGARIEVAGVLELCVDMAKRARPDEALSMLLECKPPFIDGDVADEGHIGLDVGSAHDWFRIGRVAGQAPICLVVASSATIGRSDDCAWVVDHPSVEERHVRVVYYARRYWLQPLERTVVDGRLLGARDVAVVRDGMTIEIGDISIDASVPRA
jgi:pSer/pThr/pTyr-binding forkhead associated (FHA) protein